MDRSQRRRADPRLQPERTLASVLDSAGRTSTFSYNPAGELSQATLPDGRYVAYGYNSSGELMSVRDARGGTTTYGYNPAGLLASITDQNDHVVVQNTYDPTTGRIIGQQDANGNQSSFAWNPSTQTATYTDARGNAWHDVYVNNVLISRSDPLGDTTTYGYDSNLDLLQVTDPNNHTTTMAYDNNGNLVSRELPGKIESWTYDAMNDVTSYTDGRGYTTSYGYDGAGNLTSVTGANPNETGLTAPVTLYGRDPGGSGLLVSETDPRGKLTSFGYDTAGELTSITDPLGNKTTVGYDASGRATSMIDPRGNVQGANPSQYTTSYGYDNADHVQTATNPLGGTTATAYDPARNVSSVIDANHHTTAYAYFPNNKLETVTAPDGTTTGYTYDQVGDVLTRTDANNHTTTYTYDTADRVNHAQTPANRSFDYSYDKNGNLTKIQEDPSSQAISFGYDALNQLTFINAAYQYSYDADGNLVSAACVNSQACTSGQQHTYTYDPLDRPTGTANTGAGANSISYTYDQAGNLASRTINPSGGLTAPVQTSYTYDNDERLQTTTAAGGTTNYSYDPASELITTTLPSTNGYVESRTYDPVGRLSEIKTAKGSSILADIVVTRDAIGNPLSMLQTGASPQTANYTYDPMDRVLSVCYQASPCTGGTTPYIRWTYDPVGNRLTEARPSGTTNYGYNADDELLSATGPSGTANYSYDPWGEETQAGSATYQYDGQHQLTSVTNGTTTTTYTPDATGLPVQASTGTKAAQTTNFLWDPVNPVPQLALESDGSQTPLRSYAYGTDRTSMSTYGNGAGTYYYSYDPLGSVINLTNASGATQWTNSYEPFGTLRSQTKNNKSAPVNPMLFTGEYQDSTGLYDLRAREYDPTTGRFLTPDPLQADASVPFHSAYPYVADQPTTAVDPTGLCGAVPNPFDSSSCLDEAASGAASWVGDKAGPWAVQNAGDIAGVTAGVACAIASDGACIGALVIAGGVGEIQPVRELVSSGDWGGFVCSSAPNVVTTALGIAIAKGFSLGDEVPGPVKAWASGPGLLWSTAHGLAGDSCGSGSQNAPGSLPTSVGNVAK